MTDLLDMPICAPAQLRERNREVGPTKKEFGPDVVADYKFVFEALLREREQDEADGRAIPGDAIIHVAPWMHFVHGNDHEPVVEALRRIAECIERGQPFDEFDARTLRWTADEIVRTVSGQGGFAFRKTTKERIEDMGAAYDPWAHLPDIERVLLQRGYPKKGVIERSVWLAALHWNVPYGDIWPYVRRSEKGRRDPPRFTA